jgi:site-specific recombinase XerD
LTHWTVAAQTPDTLSPAWERLRTAWLDAVAQRSRSPHTRRAYAKAAALWLDHLATTQTPPWAATTTHVRNWQTRLLDDGSSSATVNARLSAVSSWYTFIINETHLVDGVERTAFTDARGLTRANPFRAGNLRRPPVRPYGKANPLSAGQLHQLFSHLADHAHTLTGARNHALLLTYFLTASRNHEILAMRSRDLRPSRSQAATLIWAWRGKGGKQADVVLPPRAHAAILHYLNLAGRSLHDPAAHDPAAHNPAAHDDYIWPPLLTHGRANLTSAAHARPPRPHLSAQSAVRILRTALRQAQIPHPHHYRIHDLRHSFAHLFHGDLEKLRHILRHESLATTGIYVRALREPTDDYSENVWAQLKLTP